MNERERQRLLDRMHRTTGTIGEEMPEEITVDGTTIDLTEFVFECNRLDDVEAERERIDAVKRTLNRERLRRKQRVAREDITAEEGERLVREVRGIDRALTALEGLDSPDIDEEVRRKKLEDARQLRRLVDLV